MKNNRILAAIAAMSVMASATSITAFAAETDEETVVDTAVEEVVEEEVAEDSDLFVLTASNDTEEADVEAPTAPVPPVIVDVTEIIDQIRTYIEMTNLDILNDTIIDNWDQIEKVDVHFQANEKPQPPVPAEKAEDAEEAEDDAEKPTKPLGPVNINLTDLFTEFKDLIDLDKIDFIDDEVKEQILNAKNVEAHVHFKHVAPEPPEAPVPPVVDDSEKPEPPTPPVVDDAEKPVPPVVDEKAKPQPPKGPTHIVFGEEELIAAVAAGAIKLPAQNTAVEAE